MARTSLLRTLVDRSLDEGLEGFLRARRDEGVSYRAIARELDRKHEIEVTAETVRVWCDDLDIVAPVKAAS